MSDDHHDTSWSGDDSLHLRAISELLHLMMQTDASEISIEQPDIKLHIKRDPRAFSTSGWSPTADSSWLHGGPPGSSYEPPVYPTPMPPPVTRQQTAPASEPRTTHVTLRAPMVGTFSRSPSPGAAAFVQEDDVIAAGDTVCIIEAMNVKNEIDADIGGRVARILISDGQPVEYGQPLMEIEPA